MFPLSTGPKAAVFGKINWGEKVRSRGRQAATQKRDLLMCWLLPDPLLIMDVWYRRFTYRRFFFWAETEQVSLTLECGGTVSSLCQVNQEERRKPYNVAAPRFMSTSTCHIQKACASYETFRPPTVRHWYALWSAPLFLMAEVGVLTRWTCWVTANRWRSLAPSCPRASPLDSASTQGGRKILQLRQELWQLQSYLICAIFYRSSNCFKLWLFGIFLFRPTASLIVWWMSWSWAIQVLEGLSYHVKASGNQKVIFDPKDPWILVALKALGTLEDKVKLKW